MSGDLHNRTRSDSGSRYSKMSTKGKIQTVLGPIDPSAAGTTLTHEHLSLDSKPLAVEIDPNYKEFRDVSVAMDNLWYIRQNPYSNIPNVRLFEENDAVLEEIKFFKKNGGCTIVENTTTGIRRDPQFYKRVAIETGVNIVSGTGFYVESSRPGTTNFSQEKMEEQMRSDIVHGADGTDIKSGIIGEVGCSWPLGDSEKVAVRASAEVQSEFKCPVMIHPGRNSKAPFEIIRIYQEAGGNVSKLVMGHLDRTFTSQGGKDLLEFAQLGCICEYDLFGIETSHYQQDGQTDMPSDAQRIQKIKFLIENGFEDKITIAHDMHTKHRLMKYGGHGYSHIFLNIVPKMRDRGISQDVIDKILIKNPQKWLTFE